MFNIPSFRLKLLIQSQPEATPTAYVPAGPLPYEDPVDLRLPLHFDGCAEIRELPMDADDPMRIAIKAVDDEFTAMMDLYEYVKHRHLRM